MSVESEKSFTRRSGDIRESVKRKGSFSQGINRKKIFKFLVKLALVALIIFIVISLIKLITTKKVEEVPVSSEEYFTMMDNEKSGVIDKKGKIIINPEYDYVQVPNPSIDVFVCLFNYDTQLGMYSSKVVNSKNEEIYTKFNNVQSIPNTGSSSEYPFNTSVLRYYEKGKYGLITIYGDKICDPIYDEITQLKYKDGLLKAKKDGKYGLIKIDNSKFVDFIYSDIVSDAYYSVENRYDEAGFIVSIETENGYKYGYLNPKGKVYAECEFDDVSRLVEIKQDDNIYLLTTKDEKRGFQKNTQRIIENIYDKIEYNDNNMLLCVKDKNNYGVLDLTGEEVLPVQFSSISFAGKYINGVYEDEFIVYDNTGSKLNSDYRALIPTSSSDFYITIDKDNKYGVVNSNKINIIPNDFSYIEYAYGNYFIITQDVSSGVVDNYGKVIVDISYPVIQKVSGTKLIQAIDSNGVMSLYNANLEKIMEANDIKITVEDSYVRIVSENDIEYFDSNGNKLNNKELFKDNELIASEKNGKWGYVNKVGNVVIDYKYDLATDINKQGYGAIKHNGKWGSVYKDGTIVLEPTLEIKDLCPSFVGVYHKENNGYDLGYYTK